MRLLCCIVFLFVLSVKGYSPMEQSLSCDFDNSVMPLCNWQHDLNDWRGRWKQWRSRNVDDNDSYLYEDTSQYLSDEAFSDYQSLSTAMDSINSISQSVTSINHHLGESLLDCNFTDSSSSSMYIQTGLANLISGLDPLNCTYEQRNLCEWKDDPRDVMASWKVDYLANYHTHAMCMRSNKMVYASKLSNRPVSSGVTSRRPDIRYLNNPVNCSFEEGNFCGWNDDPRDVLAWWQVVHLAEFRTRAACLHLSTSTLLSESGDKLSDGVEGSARLWSGQVRSNPEGRIQCLAFKYIVLSNIHPSHVRLTLMKHSSG
ncbi:unnamed protein product [Heterobilharzia americana]|nr:unnamed protein product [Heterobilharzia americana]